MGSPDSGRVSDAGIRNSLGRQATKYLEEIRLRDRVLIRIEEQTGRRNSGELHARHDQVFCKMTNLRNRALGGCESDCRRN